MHKDKLCFGEYNQEDMIRSSREYEMISQKLNLFSLLYI